jgi:hypothetical protein
MRAVIDRHARFFNSTSSGSSTVTTAIWAFARAPPGGSGKSPGNKSARDVQSIGAKTTLPHARLRSVSLLLARLSEMTEPFHRTFPCPALARVNPSARALLTRRHCSHAGIRTCHHLSPPQFRTYVLPCERRLSSVCGVLSCLAEMEAERCGKRLHPSHAVPTGEHTHGHSPTLSPALPLDTNPSMRDGRMMVRPG